MSTRRKTQSNHRAVNKLRTMSGGSRAESERDSGFSDTSSEPNGTRGTTDSEDLTRCGPQQGATLGISQLAVVGGSSYPNMSPVIIMNNVLLKQSTDGPKPLKSRGVRPTVEGVPPVAPPPQVVFIQPVLSHPTPPSHKDPHSSRHRRPVKYLPLLKSYPRIAPHPGDGGSSSLGSGGPASSSSSSSSSASSMSSSSSSSSRSKRGTKMTSGHREHSQRGKGHHQQQQQQQKKKSQSGGVSSEPGSTAIPPASPSAPSQKPLPSVESERLARAVTVPTTSEPRELPPVAPTTLHTQAPSAAPTALQTQTQTLPTTTTLQTQTWPVATTTLQTQTVTSRDPKPAGRGADPDPETKRMRFCNTYNILSTSGLLGVTLKTKELLRQNRRTQGELDRLKEHTELFVQALLSGDPGVFLKLQTRLRVEEEDAERGRGGDAGERRDAAMDD